MRSSSAWLAVWLGLLLLPQAAIVRAETEPLAIVRPLPKDITFVYVHGFGEHRETPPFQAALDKFLTQWDIGATTETYRWDNLELKPTMVVAQWNQSKKKVLENVTDFTETVIGKYEQAQTPYVLIGYSLGSRLVAAALKENTQPLNSLLGVYFLGSALPNDHQFTGLNLPEGMTIANYYSAKFDITLKYSFYHAEGIRAGGEIGFKDPLIKNYRTACHHLYLKGPIRRDYSTLAAAIAWQAYFQQGVFFSPEKDELIPRIKMPAGSGTLHWNEVFRAGKIIIEQNANAEIYRAVEIGPDGKRTLIDWNKNMHQLLSQVDLYPAEAIRLSISRKAKK